MFLCISNIALPARAYLLNLRTRELQADGRIQAPVQLMLSARPKSTEDQGTFRGLKNAYHAASVMCRQSLSLFRLPS